jgi:uncharacterized phage infection (PIP) family protein YhgE
VENLTSYIVVSLVSFVAGFLLDLYLHRRTNGGAEDRINEAQNINSQLNSGTEQLEERTVTVKRTIVNAKNRTGEMAEVAQRIADGTDKLNKSVERGAEAIAKAEGAIRTAEDSIAKIEEILAAAEIQSKD